MEDRALDEVVMAGPGSRGVDPEEAILRGVEDGKKVSLERVLLVLSGLKTEEEIRFHQYKIDDIYERFLNKCSHKHLSIPSPLPLYLHRTIAQFLFEYLWNSKPKRYGEHFLLAEVIDAQLSPDVHRSVGTCVGLASLYSVLGVRTGLQLSFTANSDHLLSRLRVGEQVIDLDHTDPQGFDCGSRQGFSELPLPALAANVLNSRGLWKEKRGEFAAAADDFGKALRINPRYANACNNRGNMRFREGDLRGAVEDYTEALRLNPSFCEAYCNRGMACQRLGWLAEARRDYERAASLNVECTDALRLLQLLDETGLDYPESEEPPEESNKKEITRSDFP